MAHINVEIKAKCHDPERVRKILTERGAEFRGVDHQVDTYFVVPKGRLKLREGSIENYLIFYDRKEDKNSKTSHVQLAEITPTSHIKVVLKSALETLAIVDKQREIYFIHNVKFHIDNIKGLGSFIEIEARDPDGILGLETITKQCAEFIELFCIKEDDLLDYSYSDLVMKNVAK